MTLIGQWILDWLLGWGGLSVVVALCAGAVWWFTTGHIRSLAFNVAIGALAFNSVYSMGYENGAATTKTEWKAEEKHAVEQGTSAHDKAEREVPPAVDEPLPAVCPEPAPAPGSVAPVRRKPAPVPRWMSDDRHNRDNH